MKLCLDLFAGLGGFSSAFADADDWEVFTVEIGEKFDPDLQADILDLRPADILEALPVDSWDDLDEFVVVASPPCTQFSIAASSLERIVDGEPQTEDAREAVALVYHTMGLIRGMKPDWWFMENPQGFLRQVIGEPEARVTYCQYGAEYMKPTDLWGDHPPSFEAKACSYGSGCHQYNTDQDHGGEGNVRTMFQQTTSGSNAAERSLVPYELSKAILDAVETPESKESLVMWSE